VLSANPLPQPITLATTVPFGDSFLLIGGMTGNSSRKTYLSTIYWYNPDEDSWNLLDASLKEGKAGVIAIVVDRETVCSGVGYKLKTGRALYQAISKKSSILKHKLFD
jgi:N-acetylneuraminic acid mutarotase